MFFALNARAELFDAKEMYLDNGLRVIVSENHKAPVAKVVLFYKVGAIDEISGKSGLAHLLEHLMFRGTKKVPASNLNEIMHQNGVEYNAYTSADLTAYHETVDISRLELVLFLEADRMTNLDISDEAFEGEQKIVFEERQQRIDNNPKSLFNEEVHHILWQNTPYAHPIAGFKDDIKRLTKEDALDFYRRYYAPDNAVLVISGDITPKEGFELAQKYFGKIDKKSDIQRRFDDDFSAVLSGGKYQIEKYLEHTNRKNIVLRYVAPSVLTDPKKAYALALFSSYFGESQNSYLKKQLVEKGKLVEASCSADIYSRGPGTFYVAALPIKNSDDAQNFAVLSNALKQAIERLTPEDVEKEKNKNLSWFVYIKDNPEDAAFFLGKMAALGFGLEDIQNYEKNIENVSFDDIQNTVSEMIEKSKNVYTLCAPKEEL